MNKKLDWTWPNGKHFAVIFNVCLEAWSDGKAPGTRASSAIIAARTFTRKLSKRRMAAPDIWVGTRAQVVDHVLSSEAA
jgi:hypothetical protein